MYKTFFKLLSLVLIIAFSTSTSYNQEVGDSCIIRTHDKQSKKGLVVAKDSDAITLKLENQKRLTILSKNIKSIRKLNNPISKFDTLTIHSAATSKYFYGQSSYGLKKGEGYFQSSLVYNQFAYGLTDEFSIGIAGIPGFIFDDETYYGLSGKYNGRLTNKTRWGLGLLYGNLFQAIIEDIENKLIVNTTITFGNSMTKATLGYAVSFNEMEIYSLGGSCALSNKFSLLFETNFLKKGFEDFFKINLMVRYVQKYFILDVGYGVQSSVGNYNFPNFSVIVPLRFKNNATYKNGKKKKITNQY